MEVNKPAILIRSPLNPLPNFQRQLTQSLQRNFLPRIQCAEHFRYCFSHFLDYLETAFVQQPPTQTQVPAISFEIVAIPALFVIIVVVLEIDARSLGGWVCGERNDGGEVVAAAEQVELDAR